MHHPPLPALPAKVYYPNREVFTLLLFDAFLKKNIILLQLFKMPRVELTPQMRARIVELSSERWSAPRIHRKYPEIPLSTIRFTIKWYLFGTTDFTSKPRIGRPRALTEEQRDHVYDIVTNSNPQIKMRDLLREVNDDCKKRCMQSLLRSMDKKKWIQKKRPYITPAHAQKRLEWAIRHQAYTLND